MTLEPISTEGLVTLIRQTAVSVDKGGTDTIGNAVAELRKHIAPDCHVGKGDEMNGSDAGYRMQLEWYAGQLLSMIDSSSWFGINSWLNCVDKFTARQAMPNVA